MTTRLKCNKARNLCYLAEQNFSFAAVSADMVIAKCLSHQLRTPFLKYMHTKVLGTVLVCASTWSVRIVTGARTKSSDVCPLATITCARRQIVL